MGVGKKLGVLRELKSGQRDWSTWEDPGGPSTI